MRPADGGSCASRIGPLLLAVASVAALAASSSASAPRVVHVTARRFEYEPSEIHVAAGESVVLELESIDRTHGFSIPELHVRADVEPGRTTRVTLPPAVPGIYVFACDVFCGSHHEEMAGELIVE